MMGTVVLVRAEKTIIQFWILGQDSSYSNLFEIFHESGILQIIISLVFQIVINLEIIIKVTQIIKLFYSKNVIQIEKLAVATQWFFNDLQCSIIEL